MPNFTNVVITRAKELAGKHNTRQKKGAVSMRAMDFKLFETQITPRTPSEAKIVNMRAKDFI